MKSDDNFWLNLAAIYYIRNEHEKRYPRKKATLKETLFKLLLFLIADTLFIAWCSYMLEI